MPSKKPNGAKRHGQFFLYLPAEGGRKWIDALKRRAKLKSLSPSELIRRSVDRYLELERLVAFRAKAAGVSRYKYLKQLLERDSQQ